MTTQKLVTLLRSSLKKASDPAKAAPMQAYMKSEMPYHGVPSPVLKKVSREVFSQIELPDEKTWQALALGIWRAARFREERYAALQLTEDRRARDYQRPAAMKMYEEMIVTGAWWDYVDQIASRRVGVILRDYPEPMKRKLLTWSRSPNLWKRRTSILAQLSFKDTTDLDLLYQCIEPSLDSSEFFLRKAIGWALRSYAWTNPKEIRRYVRAHQDRLSPLSRREALKNL